jgi:hypothetical protein
MRLNEFGQPTIFLSTKQPAKVEECCAHFKVRRPHLFPHPWVLSTIHLNCFAGINPRYHIPGGTGPGSWNPCHCQFFLHTKWPLTAYNQRFLVPPTCQCSTRDDRRVSYYTLTGVSCSAGGHGNPYFTILQLD